MPCRLNMPCRSEHLFIFHEYIMKNMLIFHEYKFIMKNMKNNIVTSIKGGHQPCPTYEKMRWDIRQLILSRTHKIKMIDRRNMLSRYR